MPSPRTTHVSSMRGNLQAVGLMVAFSFLGIILTGGRVVEGALSGALLFLVYRIVLVGMVLCRAHRRGINLTRDGDFPGALAAFKQSATGWQRRRWLDRRRGWLLGSASRWPFHARALYNQGYCLSQLGRDPEALAVLDEMLHEYGEMGIAAELRGAIVAAAPPPSDWGELLEEAEQ
ncbi:MAG: hypothetical protein ACI8S6_005007 [Myxococcota bacterium]|jgi:hypothetical protein